MVWAILALIGVPLWLCAVGIFMLVYRNRQLRKRPGNVPVRLRGAEKERWVAGHALWTHDVLAFRGSPAAWTETLEWVSDATSRPAGPDEAKKLHRVGDEPVVVTLTLASGTTLEVAGASEHRSVLLGPFAPEARPAD